MSQSKNPNAMARITNSISFPFNDLMPEIQIMILEHTDLVCPDGYKYYWRPSHEFYIMGPDTKPSGWESPLPLFLVNKSFSTNATNVFWGRNDFGVNPLISLDGYYKLQGLLPENGGPLIKRYAASMFLTRAIPNASLPYIRSLHLSFLGIDWWTMHFRRGRWGIDAETAKEMKNDWFQTLNDVQELGLTNLEFVKIAEWITPINHFDMSIIDRGNNEDIATAIRNAVIKNMWPLEDRKPRVLINKGLTIMLWIEEESLLCRVRREAQIVPDIIGPQYRQLESRMVVMEKKKDNGAPDIWIEEFWIHLNREEEVAENNIPEVDPEEIPEDLGETFDNMFGDIQNTEE